MAKKKKKRKKIKALGIWEVSESPTAQDLILERREQRRNQEDYWMY